MSLRGIQTRNSLFCMSETSPRTSRTYRRTYRFPNMTVDIAARIGELGTQPRAARKFFDKYQDRILFGTDATPHGKDVPQQYFGDSLYEIYFRFLESEDENTLLRTGENTSARALAHLRAGIAGWESPQNVFRKRRSSASHRYLMPSVLSSLFFACSPRRQTRRVRDFSIGWIVKHGGAFPDHQRQFKF